MKVDLADLTMVIDHSPTVAHRNTPHLLAMNDSLCSQIVGQDSDRE